MSKGADPVSIWQVRCTDHCLGSNQLAGGSHFPEKGPGFRHMPKNTLGLRIIRHSMTTNTTNATWLHPHHKGHRSMDMEPGAGEAKMGAATPEQTNASMMLALLRRCSPNTH